MLLLLLVLTQMNNQTQVQRKTNAEYISRPPAPPEQIQLKQRGPGFIELKNNT
jgi:hypothetical protein